MSVTFAEDHYTLLKHRMHVVFVSIKEASDVADFSLDGVVVRSVLGQEGAVASAVHHLILGCLFVSHVLVLGRASPHHQVLPRLQSGAHRNTREQIVVLGLEGLLHGALFADVRLVKVEGAVAHERLPLLGLELVVTWHLEGSDVLTPSRSLVRVLGPILEVTVGNGRILLSFGLLLGDHVSELAVKDLVARLLTQLGFDLGTVLHVACLLLSQLIILLLKYYMM